MQSPLAGGYAYLASPYSHESQTVRTQRYYLARKFITWAFRQHLAVFSPIAHWHPVATSTKDFPTDFESFKVQNDAMLDHAQEVWILNIEGWDESKGVTYELDRAVDQGIIIRLASQVEGGEWDLTLWKGMKPL